jgi:hypothetical protein
VAEIAEVQHRIALNSGLHGNLDNGFFILRPLPKQPPQPVETVQEAGDPPMNHPITVMVSSWTSS